MDKRTCDKCLYFNTNSDAHPCKTCSHNYISHYEEIPGDTNYDQLIRFPVEKLAKVIQCTKWFDPKIECDKNLDCYMCKLRWLKKEGTI